ncbi:MAG: CD225/dispanin family protein [Thermoleophilia bacterium]|nr:CD225/dispanin family protein [Thermoleophilia bacterium]
MYCPRCGAPTTEEDRFCHACGLDLTAYRPPADISYHEPARYSSADTHDTVPHVPSYLGWAIVVTLFCFWPTGIVALVHATRVTNRLAVGDIAGAQASSGSAKTWCWITFAIGVVAAVVVMTLVFLALTVTPFIIF